jgi:hypothetical protein
MSDATLSHTFVMLCDWRGRCVWVSADNLPVKVGEFIWHELTIKSQKETKVVLGQVVAVRETQHPANACDAENFHHPVDDAVPVK